LRAGRTLHRQQEFPRILQQVDHVVKKSPRSGAVDYAVVEG
jgi:hypothetical protein